MTRRVRAHEDQESLAPASPADSHEAIPDHTKLPLHVHLRLASCRNLLMRESRRCVESWGLTLPQFDVLAELGRSARGGFTFGELSRMLLVTSGNLTGIVDRLESEGLARREKGKRDRRVVRIVLTRKGRRLVEQITPLHARDIEAALAFMSAQQLDALNELLGALRDGLRDRSPAVRQTRRAATTRRGQAQHRSNPARPGSATSSNERTIVPLLKEATRKSEA